MADGVAVTHDLLKVFAKVLDDHHRYSSSDDVRDTVLRYAERMAQSDPVHRDRVITQAT
jgi:c-di-AMP phosphodiesterase-like protein